MKTVLVSQRVVVEPSYGERRDGLDQAWARLLHACDLIALPVPNRPELVAPLAEAVRPAGVLLTGGPDLVAYGGDSPERDATEAALLELALARGWPLLGVCRGMQFIQHHFGVPLERVQGHVARHQTILVDGCETEVNSFHNWGAFGTCAALDVWATAPDGVVKAVRHRAAPLLGFMWHPERIEPFAERDTALIRQFFGTS